MEREREREGGREGGREGKRGRERGRRKGDRERDGYCREERITKRGRQNKTTDMTHTDMILLFLICQFLCSNLP
jgi:hypothetical protein